MAWPNNAKAAISITMDNLGEAQDVLQNNWPHPIGTHPAVTTHLPKMLSLLAKHDLHATYFAESWSLDVYPDAVQTLADGGHEVAWHGFQHEVWHSLSALQEEENFERSFERARKRGVVYKGFRPPGGSINDRTYAMLLDRGVKYVSPLGKFGIKEGVVVLPFEWRGVDAFYYMEKFARIRKENGEAGDVMSPADFEKYLLERIERVVHEGGYLSVLFHPFLTINEERFKVMGRVVQEIARRKDIWCAPCGEVAEWVVGHRDGFEF